MPRLPSANDVARVIPQNRGGIVQARPDETNQAMYQLGQTVTAIGNDLLDRQRKEQERLETLQAEEAFNELRRRQLEAEKGENGYESVKGSNAIKPDAFKPFTEKRNQWVTELSTSLPPAAQRKFKLAADRLGVEFESGILSHKQRETQVYKGQVLDGTIDAETQVAAAAWADTKTVEGSRNSIILALAQAQERDGIAPEKIAALKGQALGRLDMTVMQQAIAAGDVQYAKDYMSKYGSELSGADRTRVHEAIKGREMDVAVEMEREKIISQNLSDADSLKAASQIKDPEVRKRVRAEVYDMLQDKKAAEDEQYDPTRTLLGTANAEARMISKSEQKGVLDPLRVKNPALYDKAAKEIYAHNEKVRTDQHQARQRWKAAQEDSTTAQAAFVRRRYDMMMNPDPYRAVSEREFGGMVSEQVQKGKLTVSQAKELQDDFFKIKRGETASFTTFTSGQEHFNRRLRGVVVDGVKFTNLPTKRQQEISDQFAPAMDEALRRLEISKNGKATPDEIKAAVDSMFVTKYSQSTFLGIPYGKADVAEQSFDPDGAPERFNWAAVKKTVPDDARVRIEKNLRDTGQEITPENVMQVWMERDR